MAPQAEPGVYCGLCRVPVCLVLLLTLAGLCQALPTARDKRQAFHLVPLTSDNSTAITYDNSTGKEGSNPSPPMGLPPLGTSSGFEPQNTSQVDDDDMGNQFPDSGCINLCSLGNHCKNGGTCLFNVTTCSLHCACPEGYDPDRHCSSMGDNSSPSGVPFSNSTLRPLSQRECHGNRLFVCYHGQCLNTTEDTGLGGWLCACDPGWSGDFCTDPCTRDCGTRGTCRLDGVTREEYCSCNWPWQGVTCDDLPPPDPVVDYSKVYWLAGGLGVGVLVLVVCGVVLLVYMWKKRFILVMKIVHYFQPYEDSDGKLFDAFVSYRSCEDDFDFVYNELRHRLETEMNFRLCLHERDFLVGEPIANNIIWATENSRRTILVLSPRYLDSGWARMEYQQAQYETLQRKQRIIPILLEDISSYRDTMDPNLACILRTVTYLEHPGPSADSRQVHKFWKRLQLSMPKRKDNCQPTSSDDVTDTSVTQRAVTTNETTGFSCADQSQVVQPSADTLESSGIHYTSEIVLRAFR